MLSPVISVKPARRRAYMVTTVITSNFGQITQRTGGFARTNNLQPWKPLPLSHAFPLTPLDIGTMFHGRHGHGSLGKK